LPGALAATATGSGCKELGIRRRYEIGSVVFRKNYESEDFLFPETAELKIFMIFMMRSFCMKWAYFTLQWELFNKAKYNPMEYDTNSCQR
jgi:hypothetical protein